MSAQKESPVGSIAHQEVLVSYNYRICQAPSWYVDLWFKHLREDQQMSEETLHVMARKESRLGGFPIAVPAPDRNSDRFLACPVCGEHVGLDCSAVSCAGECRAWYHLNCVTLPANAATGSKNQVSDWMCPNCA